MRAAPGQPHCPGLLRLRGGSPVAGPGKAALQLGLLSQLKRSFQQRPAPPAPAPGRALCRLCAASGPAALPAPPAASFWSRRARRLPGAARPELRGTGSEIPRRSPPRLFPLLGPRSFLFRGEARPRQLAGRKCRSLETAPSRRAGSAPSGASAFKRRGTAGGTSGRAGSWPPRSSLPEGR